MTINIDTRTIQSPTVTEIYISATPTQKAPPEELAKRIFSGIGDALRSKNARILQERVFATAETIQVLSRARSQAYSDLDDGVAPSFLIGKESTIGSVAGVQVYAVSGSVETEVIKPDKTPSGRILRAPGHTLITLSGISDTHTSRPTDQARSCLEKAESTLLQFNTDFLSVARTWVWLGDILAWYDDFNHVRNKFFTERGLIGQETRQSMPASTGIGLGLDGGCECALDLIAVLEPADSTKYLQAVGKQQCALEYGSAFSRASSAITPAGKTVFVSGTASIDAAGATTNIGDALGQINTTIDNVRAVLRDTRVTDEDVVHAVAYCKTTDIEKLFNTVKNNLPWPWVTTICDICRPGLLFEIEATAIAKQTA